MEMQRLASVKWLFKNGFKLPGLANWLQTIHPTLTHTTLDTPQRSYPDAFRKDLKIHKLCINPRTYEPKFMVNIVTTQR